MKNLLIILLFVVSSCRAQYNSTQMIFQVQNYLQLSGYQGTANRVHVLSQNEDYILCTPCTVNGVTVLQGFGWRKWKLFNPPKVDTIWRVAGIDSTYFTVNGRVHSILDSTGSGSLTYIDAGTNVSITGTGSSSDHYVINAASGTDTTWANTDLILRGNRGHQLLGYDLSYTGTDGSSVTYDLVATDGSHTGQTFSSAGDYAVVSRNSDWSQSAQLQITRGNMSLIQSDGNYNIYFLPQLATGFAVTYDPGSGRLFYDSTGSGGGGGSVTYVGATATGALTFTGSPITSSGTLALGWTGDTTKYVRGDGSLATFPTTARDSLFGVLDNTLTANRSVALGAYTFAYTSTYSGSSQPFTITNTNGGSTAGFINSSSLNPTISVQNTSSGAAVFASSSNVSGFPFQGNNTAGGLGASLRTSASSTNSMLSAFQIIRGTSGTPANGIGVAMDFKATEAGASDITMARVGAKWTDVTSVSRSAQLEFWTTRSATNAVRLIITDIPTYADEAAATTGGLTTGTMYKTSTGTLMIKL